VQVRIGDVGRKQRRLPGFPTAAARPWTAARVSGIVQRSEPIVRRLTSETSMQGLPATRRWRFWWALLGAAWLRAQDGDGLPTEYVMQVPPGAWIDLDTGIVLPRADHRRDQADLRFGRDGGGFYLEPRWGGASATPGDVSPPDGLTADRVRIPRHAEAPLLLFARTDRGMARVELMVADPYSTASASLRWVVVPPKDPLFLAPPTELAATWNGKQLVVSWRGEQPRWLVQVTTGEVVRKLTASAPQVAIEDLDPAGRHHVVVRGLTARNDATMPAELVQFGQRQPPQLGRVDYPDRWYDGFGGGLQLSRGEVSAADAEVVFYLYGVHVPGGGVIKHGSGQRDFEALHELPAGPFPPIYGRLDDHDVLVVRLADGRYGKLWLEPTAGDVRSGMRVHFVFLPDGRRTLLTPPAELAAERDGNGQRLRWAAVPGAVRYRVRVGERVLPTEPKEPTLRLSGLEPDRVIEVEVVAIAADGEVSAPVRTVVLTYAVGVQHGAATIRAQSGGVDFALGAAVADGNPCDLKLIGAAGNANSLHFQGLAITGAGSIAFGDFAAAARLRFEERWTSDDRQPDHDGFFVRTADGGLANVRIVRRGWPETLLEYVWQQAPTYPAGSTHGMVAIMAQRGGVDFGLGAVVAEGQPCDLKLVGGAGNANVFHFEGAAIAGAGPTAFGDFAAAAKLSFATSWSSDDSKPDHDRFFVRTADGGLASVRIVRRSWPEPLLEYLRPPKR
jgi:hypothetical protein